MSEFYLSVEWDLLDVPAKRNEKYYTCCEEPYIDITFNVSMRRKTLFYTVNLIIPCIGISFLTILVFYLPSDSGEKVIQTYVIKYIVKSFQISVKLSLDLVILGDEELANENELIKILDEIDENWFIGCDNSSEWKQAVIHEKKFLFSLGRDTIKV